MKNKVIIIATVCLLTAGGSAIYFTAQPSSAAVASSRSSAKAAGTPAPGSVTSISKDSVTGMSEDPTKDSPNSRLRPVGDYHELDEKYGASRVRLTKSTTDNFMKVMDAMLQMQEFQLSQQGKEPKESGVKIRFNEDTDPLASVTGLTLSDEQKAKVTAARAKQMAKEIDDLRAALTRFSKNRTGVMEMMLASDAANRGQMSPSDCQAVVDRNDISLVSIEKFKPNENTIQNPLYRTELPSILDEDQMVVFEKFRSTQEAEAAKGPVAKKLASPLGIRETSGDPQTDARTLESIDDEVRKVSTAVAGMLKMVEAAREH